MAPTDDQPNIGQVLKGYATTGTDKLTLPEGIGSACAKVCAEVLRAVDDARKLVADEKLTTVEPLSSLLSGTTLAAKFTRRGGELDDILGSHATILTDLGEAFVLADKSYHKADDKAAADFDGIRTSITKNKYAVIPKPDGSGVIGADWQDTSQTLDRKEDKPPTKEQLDGLTIDKQPVNPEPGVSIDWRREYQAFADHYDANNFRKSQMWNYLAQQLSTAFGEFGNQLSTVSGEWTGYGKEAAISASTTYAAATTQLTNEMDWVGNTLNYIQAQIGEATSAVSMALSGSYSKTTKNADGTVTTESGTMDDTASRNAAIGVIDTTYKNAINSVSDAIPLLTPPKSPVVTKPDPRTTTSGSPTSGSPTSGSPTSGSPTGGTTGPGATQTAANSRAAQQAAADQRKAQQEADQRARQAQADYEKQRQQVEREAAQREADQTQQAAQQQAQQAAQQAASQAQDALKQGLDSAKSAAEQAAQQAQAAAAKDMQSAGLAGLPSALSALGKDALKAGAGAGKGGGAGGGAGIGAAAGLSPNSLSSKLFPRAALGDAAAAASPTRAGLAASQPGSPGGMGPAGHGAGGQNKEHKRAAYLDSVEHIEEALGDAPVVVKPVVEQ
ncbi:hypothetical protein ACW2Q0_22355 [Nocardia sp. R16R-3T]